MKIVTLCGSTKFKPWFEKANKEYTLKGCVVLSCGVFSHYDKIEITPEQKQHLDKLHQYKIEMSEAIIIIVVNNYIGDSTMKEIEYASSQGKEIIFYNCGE